jgi:hypothetical protein
LYFKKQQQQRQQKFMHAILQKNKNKTKTNSSQRDLTSCSASASLDGVTAVRCVATNLKSTSQNKNKPNQTNKRRRTLIRAKKKKKKTTTTTIDDFVGPLCLVGMNRLKKIHEKFVLNMYLPTNKLLSDKILGQFGPAIIERILSRNIQINKKKKKNYQRQCISRRYEKVKALITKKAFDVVCRAYMSHTPTDCRQTNVDG